MVVMFKLSVLEKQKAKLYGDLPIVTAACVLSSLLYCDRPVFVIPAKPKRLSGNEMAVLIRFSITCFKFLAVHWDDSDNLSVLDLMQFDDFRFKMLQ